MDQWWFGLRLLPLSPAHTKPHPFLSTPPPKKCRLRSDSKFSTILPNRTCERRDLCQSFFLICPVICLSVLSFIPLGLQPKDWFLCSLFLAHDWFFSFRPSLLDLAGGISTQLPALAKKNKRRKRKEESGERKKKSHGELWFLIGF